MAREALRPLSQPEIATHLKVLLEMYGPVEHDSEAEAKLYWSAWYRDLSEWPGDLVLEAIERWRRGPARSRPKTSGQLMDMVRDEMLRRRAFEANVRTAKKRLTEQEQWLSEHVVAPVGSAEHTRIRDGLKDLARRLRRGDPIRPLTAEQAQRNFDELAKAAREERQ